MTEKGEIYRCKVCGNIIEVLHPDVGELVCSGVPMELLTEQTEGTGEEKHVPVLEKIADGLEIRVGEIPHPMEEKHYIEFVELVADGKVYLKFLKPGEQPMVEFPVDPDQVQQISVREYCIIHGLWKS
jgi:superoxide reductase